MATLQTKITFAQKKNVSLRQPGKGIGKENAHLGIVVPRSEISETFTQVTSPSKGSPDKRNRRRLNTGGDEASPPKLNCILSDKSPSYLISNIKICSPQKEDHKPVHKELFPSESGLSEARKALHSSLPCRLPGRNDKLEKITKILISNLEVGTSASIYISGPPGTGKTACLTSLISNPQVVDGYQVVYINCTGIKSSGAIYSRIITELGLKVSKRSEKVCLSTIETYLQSSHKMILLVLDEIDQLDSKRQTVLYTIMEWPSIKNSKLVLVGIANALDLTDRVLPRLKSSLPIQPILIHFEPYNKQQIVDIITDRLEQANVIGVLNSGTLQLLASKVASISGDVRKALDLARRLVDLAQSNNSTSISLQEVMVVVNNVYGTSQTLSVNSSNSTTDAYPLQQKLFISTLLLIKQNSKKKDITIGKLHEVYKKVCERRNLSALDLSEFLSLASLVEARGVTKIVGKVKNRLAKIILQWDEKEVSKALQDKDLLAAILSDVSCLSI